MRFSYWRISARTFTMSVSGTIINQTFRPLEMMMITMAIYLLICVFVTTSLNRFHQRLTAREAR